MTPNPSDPLVACQLCGVDVRAPLVERHAASHAATPTYNDLLDLVSGDAATTNPAVARLRRLAYATPAEAVETPRDETEADEGPALGPAPLSLPCVIVARDFLAVEEFLRPHGLRPHTRGVTVLTYRTAAQLRGLGPATLYRVDDAVLDDATEKSLTVWAASSARTARKAATS